MAAKMESRTKALGYWCDFSSITMSHAYNEDQLVELILV